MTSPEDDDEEEEIPIEERFVSPLLALTKESCRAYRLVARKYQ
ncbi:MAG TPA: hypothetical protein VFZ67_10850 [Nitrososphaera sp.]